MNAVDFWTGMRREVGDLVRRISDRGTVSTLSAGKVTVIRVGNVAADSELYGRIAGFNLAASDEVALLSLGGSSIVLGKIQRVAPTAYALDARMDLAAAGFTLPGASGSMVPVWNGSGFVAGSAPFVNHGIAIADFSGDAATDQAPTVGTYVPALTRNITLPANGTYSVVMGVWGTATHSVAGTGAVNYRAAMTGQVGGINTLVTGTTFREVRTWTARSGVAGGTAMVFTFEFAPNVAGQASMVNPLMHVAYWRTA